MRAPVWHRGRPRHANVPRNPAKASWHHRPPPLSLPCAQCDHAVERRGQAVQRHWECQRRLCICRDIELQHLAYPQLSEHGSVNGKHRDAACRQAGPEALRGQWRLIVDLGRHPRIEQDAEGQKRVAIVDPSARLCISMASSLWPFCWTWSCESVQTLAFSWTEQATLQS